jgi:hypothetical protein
MPGNVPQFFTDRVKTVQNPIRICFFDELREQLAYAIKRSFEFRECVCEGPGFRLLFRNIEASYGWALTESVSECLYCVH